YNAVQLSSANWSGTTTDNGSNKTGLSTVTLALQDLTASAILLANVPAGNPPASWTYVSTVTLTNTHQYQVTVTALDNAQNSTSTVATFIYDTQKPTTTVTSPNTVYITTWTQILGNAN